MFFILKVNGSKQEHPFKHWLVDENVPRLSSRVLVFQYVTVVSVVNATLNVHFSDGPLSFHPFSASRPWLKKNLPWLVLEATYKREHKKTWRAQNGRKMRQEWEKSLPFIMVEMRYLNLTSISWNATKVDRNCRFEVFSFQRTFITIQ